jgi:hypothetical protein
VYILNAYPYSGNWLRSAYPSKGDYPSLEIFKKKSLSLYAWLFPKRGLPKSAYPKCISILSKMAAFGVKRVRAYMVGISLKRGLPEFGVKRVCAYMLGFSPKGGLPECSLLCLY